MTYTRIDTKAMSEMWQKGLKVYIKVTKFINNKSFNDLDGLYFSITFWSDLG